MESWDHFQQKMLGNFTQGNHGLQEVVWYLMEAGGKKIRPKLVFLCGSLLNRVEESHVLLAQAIEYIHTASLFHDDVMDHGQCRRGKPCANRVWDNSSAILAGDFLLIRGFSALMEMDHGKTIALMQQTMEALLEGQWEEEHILFSTSYQDYLTMIAKKTASLFACACQGAALLSHATKQEQQALYDYGMNLGLGYQLLDDAEEYLIPASEWTKGHDFIEKKVTFPLLLAYQKASPEVRQTLLANPSPSWVQYSLLSYIQETQAMGRAYYQKARDILLSHWSEESLKPLLHFLSHEFSDGDALSP